MRRKLIPAALLAIGAACVWVAAPALSVRPYVPEAVDFEQRLPEPKRLESAGAPRVHETGGEPHSDHIARWISPPVEAPHRFDLVGVAGEMRPIEIRVREGEGGWSEWVETHSGDPIYVGGADQAQVRAPFKPAGELHYVNVSGTADGPMGRLLNSARRTINSAFLSARSAFVAEAHAPKPGILGRALWGATLEEGGCPPQGPPEYGQARAAVIHHTVNANEYTREEAPRLVLGICRFHVYANGWNDIGYNALVDRFGQLYEGRAGGLKAAVVGAQAQGFNSQTTSIASVGTHSTTKLNRKARNAVVRYLAWKLAMHRGLPATGKTKLTSAGGGASRYPAGTVINSHRVTGHRRLGLTECPGDALWAQIRGIRKRVQGRAKKYSGRHKHRARPLRSRPQAR